MDAADYVDMDALRHRIDSATPDLAEIDWSELTNTEIANALVHGQLCTLAAFLVGTELPWPQLGMYPEVRAKIAEGLTTVADELVKELS